MSPARHLLSSSGTSSSRSGLPLVESLAKGALCGSPKHLRLLPRLSVALYKVKTTLTYLIEHKEVELVPKHIEPSLLIRLLVLSTGRRKVAIAKLQTLRSPSVT